MLLTKHFQLSGYPEHREGMPFLPSLWGVGFRTNSSQQGASRGAGAFVCCRRRLGDLCVPLVWCWATCYVVAPSAWVPE